MKLSAYLFLGCFLLTSMVLGQKTNSRFGGSPEKITIDIEDSNRNLLKLRIENVIQLETSPNSLIGQVYKAEYYNNRFYVLDFYKAKTFYVFDQNGKLIRKISTGKGPGEVINPISFTINKEDNVINLHDQSLRLNLKYDIDLNYINADKIPDVFILDYQHIGGDTFLVYNHYYDRDNTAEEQYYNYFIYTEGFTQRRPLNIKLDGSKETQLLRGVISRVCP